MSIRITSWLFLAVVILLLLLFGAGGVVMGVRCTISGTVFLDRGPVHSHIGQTTARHDRTRLYGPGVILLGLSTLAAAISLPFVPLHHHRGERQQFPLYWQVIGYCMLAGFCCVMIAVIVGVR